jgi:hypothetical protein
MSRVIVLGFGGILGAEEILDKLRSPQLPCCAEARLKTALNTIA